MALQGLHGQAARDKEEEEVTLNAILALVAGIVMLSFAVYNVGFDAGRHDAIRELFGGEKDFRRYVEYRKRQMEESDEG